MTMTLDQLLALLPDNDQGEVSAADMRTIVTELFDKSEANTGDMEIMGEAVLNYRAATNARIDTLERAEDSQTFTVSGVWEYLVVPNTDPNDGQVSADVVLPVNAATLRFASKDLSGTDFGTLLPLASAIVAQQRDRAENFIAYNVSGMASQTGGTDWSIPVTVTNSSGQLDQAWPEIAVVLTVTAQPV